MIRLQNLSLPIDYIPCRAVAINISGGSDDAIPVHVCECNGLPASVRAIIATADLQRRVAPESGDANCGPLLGEVLPRQLRDICPQLKGLGGATGVILAGDFYTVPALDARGGLGDVTPVWEAFAVDFDWVVGVAGNHDQFGHVTLPGADFCQSRGHVLDGTCVAVGDSGVRIGGVSGIVGNPRKPQRKTPLEYRELARRVLEGSPEIFVTHKPPCPAGLLTDDHDIEQLLKAATPLLAICGHRHWHHPIVELPNGTQMLNVHERIVILCPAP